MTSVTLDRAQRAAIRREAGVDTHRGTDIELYFDQGDRASFVWLLEKLSTVAHVMDGVGWLESDEAPELQQVAVDDEMAAWAERVTVELNACFVDSIQLEPDKDLDALSALRVITGGA